MKAKTAKGLLRKVAADYNSISDDFDRTRQTDWKEFESFLSHIKNKDLLADLGCGNGRFYNFIRKKRKIDYTGIDISENLLKKAKKQFKIAKFIEGNLLKLPLRTRSTNVALSIASLHHIPSSKLRHKALMETRRILKKNGTLILTVWNLFQPKYKKYIWIARLRHIISLGKYDWRDTFIPWGKSGIKRYYYAFTESELQKLLKECGFKILEKQSGRNLIFICKES